MPAAPVFSLQTLLELVERRAARQMWVDDRGAHTWREFGAVMHAAQAECLAAGVEGGEVVVTPGEGTFEALGWLFGVALAGAIAAPLRSAREGELDGWTHQAAPAWRVRGEALAQLPAAAPSAAAARLFARLRATGHPGLVLATGGTTGAPKLVLHDLSALLATVPVKQGVVRRILPLMRFDHIGGLDIAWRALAAGHVLVGAPAEITPEAVAATIERHAVEVLAATPSFLNLMLVADVHHRHTLGSLRTVPFGAEPMPAGLLEHLRLAWPKVAFVQRFGTSETGALPVAGAGVGLAFAPAAAGFDWKLVDGELWVRSPSCALGYLGGEPGGFAADGWFHTGDLAERLADGSVRIVGRREELINVGGEKVAPAEVEDVLHAHPHVADCRVFAERNALLGQIVAAEVVWRGPETDPVAVKRSLHEFAAGRLARHKLPASVRLIAQVAATGNLKKRRTLSPT